MPYHRSRKPKRSKISFVKLIQRVASNPKCKDRNFTIQDVNLVLRTFISELTKALIEFEEVHVWGFGYFYRYMRARRETQHPQTGERIVIAPHYDLKFRMGLYFKRLFGMADLEPRRQPPKDPEDRVPTDL